MEKVITVDISKSKFLRANPQWQYNHGQKLQFVGVELPPYYEVHFSNSINGEAKKQLGDSSGVLIPFEYFQPGKSIYAWIYITDSDSGITQRQVEIPIHKKAICTDEEPTPEQSDIIEEAIGALNSALDKVDDRIEAALDSAKQSGEFDGKDGEDGSGVWYTTARVLAGSGNPFVRRRDLIGREGATVQVNDLLFAPDVGYEGEPTTLYEITSVGVACALNRLCKMQGEDGYSPAVTITEITGGHRITITDEAHPDGQSFDVMDGQDGTRIWWTNSRVISAAAYESDGGVATIQLHSVDGATPAVGDYVYAPEVGQSGAPTALYVITRTAPVLTVFDRICSIKGDGGSGTGDYDDLTNKPSIGGVTLSGNKTAADLGLAPAGAYVKPSGGIPNSDLASDVHLIPSGGTIGQVLRKISNNDWDIDWSDFNGCAVWWTNRIFIASTETEISYTVRQIDLNGSTGTPSVNDYVFGPVTGLGEIDSLFQISSDIIGGRYDLTPITTFHGTSDYDSLTNKPSINNVELSGDKSLSDLGIESKPMLVTLSWTGSGDIYTADKTYAEITNAMAAGREVLVDWGSSILRSSEPGFTWIGYDDGQILEFILREDSSWIGIITDLGMYRTAADQDAIDQQQNTAIAAKYTKPGTGIPKTDMAEDVQTSLSKADTALQPGDVDEPFVVTYTAASGATATCDKTYAQIMAALQAKQEVLAFYVASNSVAAQLTTVAIDTNNSDILFTNAQNGGVTTLRHNSAGTITVSSNDGYVFRDQGIANAGKVLKVGNDGTVAPETPVEPFIATYIITSMPSDGAPVSATCDKTYADLYGALNGGKEIIAFVSYNGLATVGCFTAISLNTEDYSIESSSVVQGNFGYMRLVHNNNNACSLYLGFLADASVAPGEHTPVSGQTVYSYIRDNGLVLASWSPKPLGTAAAGTANACSRSDHVHPMPSASDVGAVAKNQGSANAGKFLVVGSDGNVTAMTLAAWQGGSY